ncbi:MAG: hypothetical protein GC146_02695 [Limimaricola sp.]|uniref:HlyU family transcriptional regulator n=1 Tax=Limimaricola sp. TaxID=2211665 RepID=UPI001D723600|nr:HlyU family transcriptional regulator [Limimaricola sp.]MBI1416108.1 hypothetical protein [Limimaricola sp.]
MPFLSRLFGGQAAPAGDSDEAVEYKGYEITPTPIREGKGFRISARIGGEVDGVPKTHTLVRADVLESRDEAVKAAIAKAKLVIDEQGNRMFG